MGPLYTHSKHAVLGMMRSLSTSVSLSSSSLISPSPSSPSASAGPIRVCSIHPWFADTAILQKEIRLVLRGLPWTSITRVGGAIFRAATEPSPPSAKFASSLSASHWEVLSSQKDETSRSEAADGEHSVNGSAYLIPDDGEVFCLRRGHVDLLSADLCYADLRERVAVQAK